MVMYLKVTSDPDFVEIKRDDPEKVSIVTRHQCDTNQVKDEHVTGPVKHGNDINSIKGISGHDQL